MISHNISDHKKNIYSLKGFCVDDLRTSQESIKLRWNSYKINMIIIVLVMESFFKLNAFLQLKKMSSAQVI